MKKSEVLWIGTGTLSDMVIIFDEKPEEWDGNIWIDQTGCPFLKSRLKTKNPEIKFPRHHSKQLIPFHIVPAKGK